jgi:hypothetical protein
MKVLAMPKASYVVTIIATDYSILVTSAVDCIAGTASLFQLLHSIEVQALVIFIVNGTES